MSLRMHCLPQKFSYSKRHTTNHSEADVILGMNIFFQCLNKRDSFTFYPLPHSLTIKTYLKDL